MSRDHVSVDVLIIGAGLAGLMAARKLEEAGLSVIVLDKGRSVGGRMATRRVGPGLADHGAQFFTVRDPAFEAHVDQWKADGVVFVWSHGFSDGSLVTAPTDGHPRHAVNGGMNELTKHLAKDLNDVQINTKVVTATCDDKGWILQNENGGLFLGRSLIMTAPVPQSLQILDEGATILTREDYDQLASVEYAPCLTGVFWVEGALTLPPPGAVQRKNNKITWIGDNQQKGISKDAVIVTLQASEEYSKQMWNAPDGRILNALRTNLEIFMRDGAVVREAQLKRWRYSRPTSSIEGRVFVADNTPPLLFAGDAFGGPRVEGATLSGLAAGEKLIEIFNS